MNETGKRIWIALLVAVALTVGPGTAAAAPGKYKRSVVKYQIPDVTLVDQDGERVRFQDLLNSGKPVLMDFIYATCTTICPVMSAGFASFQRRMGDGVADKATLVSISIDPDHDSPPVMREYLKRYGAKPGWNFLTGKYDDILSVMRSFDAYVENKMDHFPLTLVRAPGSDEWVRMYGLTGTSDLIKEYKAAGGE